MDAILIAMAISPREMCGAITQHVLTRGETEIHREEMGRRAVDGPVVAVAGVRGPGRVPGRVTCRYTVAMGRFAKVGRGVTVTIAMAGPLAAGALLAVHGVAVAVAGSRQTCGKMGATP